MERPKKISLDYIQSQIIRVSKAKYNYTLVSLPHQRYNNKKLYSLYEKLNDFEQGNGQIGLIDLIRESSLIRVKDILSRVVSTPKSVPQGTLFADLDLPATVSVTYDDGSTSNRPVTWLPGTYNAAIPAVYTLVGNLTLEQYTSNSTNKKGSIAVTVTAL